MTPMMQQYWDAKAQHPGMVLLFRMGDFFETFEEDAELCAKVLGLTLTSRDGNIPMAGVPAKALDIYLRKLLHAGHRVAVCDQVEDAAQAKGLVKREVTRVVTPGTVTEDELLEPGRPNHLAALSIGKNDYGLAWVEVTTGTFHAVDVPEAALFDELNRINPAECLINEANINQLPAQVASLFGSKISTRPGWTFDETTAREQLLKHFKLSTTAGFGFRDDQRCINAAGALVIYLQETLRSSLGHIRRLSPYQTAKHLALDEVTRRSLELTKTIRDGQREGSLLSVLDRTVTPMGARVLHDALLAPLFDRDKIEARYDAIEELLKANTFRSELRAMLNDIPDLQRLTTRISTGRCSPKDLAGLGRGLRMLPKIKAKISERRSALIQELNDKLELCPDLRALLDKALTDDPPYNPKDGGVIREGYNAQLDELRQINTQGKEWLARFQAQEITSTEIPSLKVGFNQVQGYYIEVTHVHQAKVPGHYRRKATLKNAERYDTQELREYEEKALSAHEKSLGLEVELFQKLKELVADHTTAIMNTADVLAMLDFLAALGEVAATRGYVRPALVAENVLEIRDGRHPVLDQKLPPGTFVPNDVLLSHDTGKFWLITGPNMAGKSVLIKQVALIALMAHAGSFVPAKSAKVGLVDRIFTRVGASDELNRGLSTFMVEMTEAANILNNATPHSLVILDEIGRGTSTYDGVSLAWAMTEHLHEEIACRCMFATHYHELAQLAEALPNLRNYNAQVKELDQEVIFLHKIAPGHAQRSYGIHVARLAGVPEAILTRANGILGELEARHQLPIVRQRVINPPEKLKRKKPVIEDQTPNLFE